MPEAYFGDFVMAIPDVSLLRTWHATRDPDAFAEILSRHSAMVYATCKRVLGDPADAEDVAQECFIALARARKGIRCSLAGWLHTVAVRRSLNLIRAETRRRRRETQFVEENTMNAEPSWGDIQKHIDEAVAALPDKLREPIIYRFLEGQTQNAIAQHLGVSDSTVQYRLNKGIEAIRKFLKRRGVVAPTAVLASLLAKHLAAEAAPAALTTALGKLAIAGAAGAVGSSAAISATNIVALGGALTMGINKTTCIVAAICVGLVVATGGVYKVYQSARHEQPRVTPVNVMPSKSMERSLPQKPATVQPARALTDEPKLANVADLVVKSVSQGEQRDDKQEEDVLCASVSGYVMDDHGYPVGGASIHLEVVGDKPGMVLAAYDAKTSGDGRYEIGKIDVFGYAAAYASGDGYVMQRTTGLKVARGTKRDGVDFTLPKASLFIAGWVVSESKKPISGASVNLRCGRSKDGAWFPGGDKLVFAITDGEGYFRMGIPWDALCDFTVVKEGYATGFFPAVPAGTDDALFVLRSGGAISGTVTKEDGGTVEGAKVEVAGEAYPGSRDPQEKTFLPPLSIRPVTVHTDQRGGYIAEGLGEDYIYAVTATAPAATEGKDAGWAPSKKGVRVRAGETTSGVDFVLRSLEPARVYGRVTDKTSSLPVNGLEVCASSAEPASTIGTMTAPDGSYSLEVRVAEKSRFRIDWRYARTSSVGPQEVATLDLGPGAEEELNFTVPAPITVPVRFIDRTGTPLEGISIVIWDLQGNGRWGGGPISGADGRAIYEGLSPGRTYRVLGQDRDNVVVGTSDPFSGRPGETIPEVQVVCRSVGGIEGTIVGSDGTPAANIMIGCTGVLDDGTISELKNTVTDESGQFVLLSALPEGIYSKVAIAYVRSAVIERVVLDGVKITGGSITDVGTIRGEAVMTMDEATQKFSLEE